MLGFLEKMFGGGIVSAAEGVANIVDTFVETPDEKRAAENLKTKMMMEPGKVQAALNQVEAAHRSVFVAGWRPFIGWIAGLGLAAYFLPQFIMGAIIWVQACYQILETVEITGANITTVLPPYPVEPKALMELVIGMLGLGGLRTLEKVVGKAK